MRRSVAIAVALLSVLAAGGVAQGSGGGVPNARFGKGDLRVALTFDASYYRHWEDVVASVPSVTSVDTKNFRPGFGVAVEYGVNSTWAVGASLHHNNHEFEQTFGSNDPLVPTRAVGTVDALAWDVYVAPRRSIGPVGLSFPFGYSLTWDKLDLRSEYAFGDDVVTDRSLRGGKAFLGLYGDVSLTSRTSLRAGLDWATSLDDGDADDQARFRFGFTRSF